MSHRCSLVALLRENGDPPARWYCCSGLQRSRRAGRREQAESQLKTTLLPLALPRTPPQPDLRGRRSSLIFRQNHSAEQAHYSKRRTGNSVEGDRSKFIKEPRGQVLRLANITTNMSSRQSTHKCATARHKAESPREALG
jgi:hypothetical protein